MSKLTRADALRELELDVSPMSLASNLTVRRGLTIMLCADVHICQFTYLNA